MKCVSCGKEIPAGNVYCPICGKEAQIISDKIVLEDDLLKVLMESEDFSGEEAGFRNSYEEQMMAEEKEIRRQKKLEQQKKKKKQQLMLILIIVVICIVVIGIVFGIRKNNSYDSIYNKADVAYHTGKYQDAVELAVKALDKNPDSIDCYLLLGDIYVQLEDNEQAKNCYMKVLDMEQSNKSAYTKLLQLYDSTDDYDSIQTLYETVPSEDKNLLKLFDEYLIPVPEVSLKGGQYTEVIEVELSAKKEFDIYYTLDGTNPSADKEKYIEPIKLDKEGTIVLKAVCIDADDNISTVLEETYELEFAIPDIPSVTPDGGEITSPTQVSVFVQEGTTVYYTWDGSVPDKNATKYTGPFEIPEGNNILSVIAIDDITKEKSEVFKTNFIYYPEAVTSTTL